MSNVLAEQPITTAYDAEDDLPEFAPCIGSGYCCMKAQCMLSVEKHGVVKGACPELRWNGKRHLCGLMLDDEKGEYAKYWLGEGKGCCSPLNSWRREKLKDRRHLPLHPGFQRSSPEV